MSFPGIPALLSRVEAFDRTIVRLTVDGQRIAQLFSRDVPQWGLYRNGERALEADNITRLEYRAEFNISDYPVEEGAFASYNKVKLPLEVRLRFTKGGSVAEKSAFLADAKKISASLDVFDVYMPEARYQSMNVQHLEFARTALSGVGLMAIDITLVEIMETIAPGFTHTANDSGWTPGHEGTVQPQTPTSEQQNKLRRGAGDAL